MMDDDGNAKMAALEEIKNTLNRHWMRKPQSPQMNAAESQELPGEDDGVGETVAEETEELAETPETKRAPLRVVNYGFAHAASRMAPAAGEPKPPPMVKRGRGRPPKVR